MAAAFDAAGALLAKLRAQRERWVDLGEERAVKVLVLRETELGQLQTRPLVDVVCDVAVDWRGFTEASFLGAAVGASDPVPFDRHLWAEVARNSVDVCNAVGSVLIADAERRVSEREAARKN